MDMINSIIDDKPSTKTITSEAGTKLQLETTRRDHSFWYPHVENCDKADISGNQYCRENNLSPTKFSYWRCKYKREHNNNSSNNNINNNTNDFLGVKVLSRGNTTGCLCSLEFSRGHRLLIHNVDCLRMLPQILALIK